MSIESSYIEIRFLACTYNPIKNFISNHLKEIGENLDNYSSVTLETRLSDFYKMTYTVMKVLHQKQNQTMPRIGIIHFSNKAFMFEFKNSIIQMASENIDHIYIWYSPPKDYLK